MIDDGIAYARNLSSQLQESATRLGGAVRRWSESADTGRALWNDSAASEVFQRFLDPHRELLSTAEPDVAAALEAQHAALANATQAADAARRATIQITQAQDAMQRSHEHAASVRAEVANARGDIGRARAMAQDVAARVAALGE